MSTLNDLLRQVETLAPDLAADLSDEVNALQKRRAFGLNFERHTPETVELPGRPVRRGDKVRFLPERGATVGTVNEALWRVRTIRKEGGTRIAELARRTGSEAETETTSRNVDDLVVVAEFRDPIYPGLVSTGTVERGGDKPFHTVINAENFHALQALLYTHQGKVDAIYIDPPYNTGAKDWKYNNDYVDGEDAYRHSKWLAFIERRLRVARQLLTPESSALIVTIDEKEYLRLGLLLEQMFPEATIQMVSSVINPKGSSRSGRFSRVDEYLFFVYFGDVAVIPWRSDMLRTDEMKSRRVRWAGLIRNGEGSRRERIPSMFYPIYIDAKTGDFHSVGDPPPLSEKPEDIKSPPGTIPIWPIDRSGQELMWRLSPDSFCKYLDQGHAKFGRRNAKTGQRSITYLQRGIRQMLKSGEVITVGKTTEGALELEFADSVGTRSPTTVWNTVSHSASEYGAGILKALLPGRRFPYPKSPYAVEDTLRFFVKDKPNAVVLDFFAGSGTSCHAVMRLNRQDGGCRQSISITNNEVAANEQSTLLKNGFRPGDPDWERRGICDHITKPRVEAAITGNTPTGEPIKGNYKFTDEFPMGDGFEENVEFFTMSYEAPRRVAHHRSFPAVAPLLWLKAGAQGRRIDRVSGSFDVADTYGVLFETDASKAFVNEVVRNESVRMVFIVTDNDRAYQSVCKALPGNVEPVRLYASYLTSFTINTGKE